jgi:hypothetical protein
LAVAAAPWCPAQNAPAQDATAQGAWQSVYFYDEDETSLTLVDLAVLSSDRAIALGRLTSGRVRTVLIETRDGGQKWTVRRISPEGLSLFFLNANDGWMTAANGLHRTTDGGASWKQIFKSKTLLRCHFLDRSHGFAAGLDKTATETRDGGVRWTPLSAAAELNIEAGRTAFTWIDFQGSAGFITGFHKPRRRPPQIPDWMDPESAESRRQLPSLSITLQTLDRGATWRASVASMFGQISRVRIGPPGRVASVIEFEPQFEWPSEVYEIDLATGKAERSFRERDRHATDAVFLPDGTLLLAAVVNPGRMHHLPVPGPVRFLQRESGSWHETEADYRASATRVSFAAAPDGEPWAFTETMILRRRRTR